MQKFLAFKEFGCIAEALNFIFFQVTLHYLNYRLALESLPKMILIECQWNDPKEI
jgi:hypothetical protein